jgi:hypothetical protein
MDFDTIIFDLDGTIWKGPTPDFWAKKLEFPIVRDHLKIVDKNSNYILLDIDIPYVLGVLARYFKRLGFITRGGILDRPFNLEPCIQCLDMFDILYYFGYCKHILYHTDNKSRVIQPVGKTIFIDDNTKDLMDVAQRYPDITCLNRLDFTQWTELLD